MTKKQWEYQSAQKYKYMKTEGKTIVITNTNNALSSGVIVIAERRWVN